MTFGSKKRGLRCDVPVVPQNVVTCHKDIVRVSSGVSGATHSDGFKHTTTAKLFHNVLRLEVIRDEVVIGLQASDVVRHCFVNPGPKDA